MTCAGHTVLVNLRLVTLCCCDLPITFDGLISRSDPVGRRFEADDPATSFSTIVCFALPAFSACSSFSNHRVVRAPLHFRSCWPCAHPFKNSLKVARSIHEFSTEERACWGDNLSRFLSAVFAPLFRDWIFIYNRETIVVLVESFHRDRY